MFLIYAKKICWFADFADFFLLFLLICWLSAKIHLLILLICCLLIFFQKVGDIPVIYNICGRSGSKFVDGNGNLTRSFSPSLHTQILENVPFRAEFWLKNVENLKKMNSKPQRNWTEFPLKSMRKIINNVCLKNTRLGDISIHSSSSDCKTSEFRRAYQKWGKILKNPRLRKG